MSTKEIKEHLKKAIDGLSPAVIKLAEKDLNIYFEYITARHQMPRNRKLSFEEYLQLMYSLQQAKYNKSIAAQKVFADIRKKYVFRN